MEYNGHHCRNCWNVALWIGNDEGLYRLALECKRRPRADGKPPTLRQQARRFQRDSGLTRTPDGATYTLSGIMAALQGLE